MGIIISKRKLKYSDVWLEKYRPSTLDEVVMNDSYKEKFKEYIKSGSVPSMLLVGSPGTGKTTMAYILLDACVFDDMDYLEMNGSLFRGIDVIRNLDDFIKSGNDVFLRKKIIFIDEADKLTPDAQDSLRNLIEQNTDHLSFILTNYAHKITDALKSRLQTFTFKQLPPSLGEHLCLMC